MKASIDLSEKSLFVSGLYLYPVKALQGIDLSHTQMGLRGFDGDRRWMIVDSDNRFISQRSHPSLARLRVRLDNDNIHISGSSHGTVSIPLTVENTRGVRVQIWNDEIDVVRGPRDGSDYLSSFLEERVELVHMPDTTHRQVDMKFALRGEDVSFADGFPILLACQASLDDLNGRMDRPVPMNRFRPNLVVSGGSPWDEDRWERLLVGEADLRCVKPSSRCAVTTTDQETGERGKEPLRTLSSFRKFNSRVLFGVNVIPNVSSVIHCGDRVRVYRESG